MEIKVIALLVTEGTRNLQPTIESIKLQGAFVDQIIIASEKLIDSEYRVLINPYEKGLARNTMQALIRIKALYPNDKIFIATIDDDDKWKPNYIKLARCKIKQKYNFISGYLEVYKNNKIVDIYDFNENISYQDFLYGNPGVQGSNKVFALDVALKSGGMPKHINSATDRAFNINLLRFPEIKFGVIHDVVCEYDASDNRQRITNNTNKALELKKFYKHFWHLIDKNKIDEINKRHARLHKIEKVITWK